MSGKTILLIAALVLLMSACATEPETIIETVIKEVTIEVLQTLEVTRQVEVPVEVTRLIDVTKEVPVEVTRLIEVEITANPEPTLEPTPEPTPTNTVIAVEAAQPAATAVAGALPPPASDVASNLLRASTSLREHILRFRDNGLASGDCYVIVENQDNFLAAPGFDISRASIEVQSAYGHYLAALDLAKDAALGIGEGCRDAIANQKPFSITGLNYSDMIGKLERALEELAPAIEVLGSLTAE